MRKSLIKIYQELHEAHSTSDFPKLLADVMHKKLIRKFKGVSSPWRKYLERGDMADFKTHNRNWLEEAPDLIKKTEGGNYKGSTVEEQSYAIQLETFGRTFSITRETIINDDTKELLKQPERFGRATGRTIAKDAVKLLEADGFCYDGKTLFHNDHGNKVAGTLTNDAAGIALLAEMMTTVEDSTDEASQKLGIEAKMLVVPSALEDTALRITQGQQFIPVSTTGGTTQVGKVTRLEVVKEPFLTSTTKFYVMATPEDAPIGEMGFLNGKEEPDLLVQKSDAVFSAGGGDDPWGYEFDDLNFKVRHDWAKARAMYQGVVRGG